jgi:plasmid maintenance system killer protein
MREPSRRASNPAWQSPGAFEGLQYSIRINDQWRICFSWHEDEPWDVEIVDYH